MANAMPARSDRRRTVVIGVSAVALLAVAYLLGYLSQRDDRVAAQQRTEVLESRLTALEARVQTGELLGQVLTVKELAMEQNYGEALQRSSALFDSVRAQAAGAPEPVLRAGFADVLASRDGVTAGLAKADATVVATLHDVEQRLRHLLGYPMPSD